MVPGVVFGVIALTSSRDSLSDAVGRLLAQEARSTADRLRGRLEEESATLRTIARQDLMREIRIGDLDKRVASFLASAKGGNPACLALIATDASGRAVAATDPSLIGRIEGSAGEGERLRGPATFETFATPALEIAVPIPNPDRPADRVGGLVGFFDWQRETEFLDQARSNLRSVGLDVDVLVLDERGTIIAAAARSGSSRQPGVDLRQAGWRSAATTGPGFQLESNAQVLVGRAEVKRPPWTLLIVDPLRDALRPVRTLTVQLALALAAVLVSAVALGAILAGRVTKPLRELTRATRELSHEPRTTPAVRTRLRDEVGELAEAFNQMTIDLRRVQSQLLEAEKFAFVGELAAGVAHQVRTALGVLRSSVQLLQPTVASQGGEAVELAQIMLDEVDRLDSVVADLLTLGRPRELSLEKRRLSEPVLRAIDFATPQARNKGVAIRFVPSAREPEALFDEEQMYQASLNLLVNAIEILPRGGTITVSMVSGEAGRTGFEVRDDGPGIARQIRDKIFLPFFTQREGGTGLGLTFVQRVVQEHKGRVTFDSEVGQGSVFRVSLPVAGDSSI